MAGRQVDVVITNMIVNQYEARSYPDDETDAYGKYKLYSVPVYRILVKGTDADGNKVTKEFAAPRFMPFFNNPKKKDPAYKATGWINAGLAKARRIEVARYKPEYELHNRYSPGRGAIVLHQAFYIHAGPSSLDEVGFGSAGCVEIVGDYDDFKKAIADLSGLSGTYDEIIEQLVRKRKLIVTIQEAKVPDIKKSFTRKTG